MTVRDLIEKLRELPPNAEVWHRLEDYSDQVSDAQLDTIRAIGPVVIIS